MKKITKSKLSFNAQTVRTLTTQELGSVAGAGQRACTNANSGCTFASTLSESCDMTSQPFSTACIAG